MENITSFLQKFKKILSSQGAHAYVFIEIVKDELGIKLQKKDVSVRGNVIYVRVSPASKNTIFLKKKKILDLLTEQAGRHVTDIR